MNQVILIGRVVKDAEVSVLNNQNKTNVIKFTIAVPRDYKKDGETVVDFINIEQFGNDFSKLKNYVLKGTKVAISGSINIDKGTNGYFTKIKANKIELLGTNSSKNCNLEQNEQKSSNFKQKEQKQSNFGTFNPAYGANPTTIEDDEDVPF